MYTLLCAIIGERTDPFPIHIEETRIVGDLKEDIKMKKKRVLAEIEADTLALYKTDIDIDATDTAYKQVIQQISNNTTTAPKEPLLNPSHKLSAKFGKSIPADGRIHILVERPPGQSTDPIDPSVCDAVDETVLTRPVYPSLIVYHCLHSLLIVQHRRRRLSYASYLDHKSTLPPYGCGHT